MAKELSTEKISKSLTLKEFEALMISHGRGWILINKSDKLLSYQKVIPEQRGSCLLAFILLLLGIIPGVLYLYFSKVASSTHQLIIHLNDDGTLLPSGDHEGMRLYQKLVNTQSLKLNENIDLFDGLKILAAWANRHPIWTILIIIFIIWVVRLSFMNTTHEDTKQITPPLSQEQIDQQKKIAAEQAAKKKADEAAWAKTKAGKLCAKHPDWSKDDCQNVVDDKYWIGMNFDMLKVERGAPNSSNPSNYGGGTKWQWCWYNYTPFCFYGGDDGIVTSYN